MTMTRTKILAAQAEAQRFIQAADEALARLDAEVAQRDHSYAVRTRLGYDGPMPAPGPGPDDYSYGSAATGTLRRRSMDLTRSLATLRRSNVLY